METKANRTNWVYILASQKRGTLYTGSTSDLILRLEQHRSGAGSKFVSRHRVLRLVWFEMAEDMDMALLRERRIKGWRRDWKFELIEATNPNWMDLTDRAIKSVENADW